jgi:ABC-2 type transport system permease protein
MNTVSNVMPGSPEPQMAAVRTTRPMYWSLHRELWENRSIYIAPLSVAALILFGFLISLHKLPAGMRLLPLEKQHEAVNQFLGVSAVILIVTSIVVGFFYCLDALYGERRDRSVLFWKSLPVSDMTAVLGKVIVAMAILPAITFVVILVLHLLMMLFASAALLAGDVSPGIWWESPFFADSLVLLYGLIVTALWHAPIYGWLLVVSAWAKRTTFLWALLPPVALAVVERIAFGTSYVGAMLKNRVAGGFNEAFNFVPLSESAQGPHGIPQVTLSQIDPGKFLSSGSVWGGLAVAVAFIAIAIWLRRNREPI